ncbi:lipopolysaccharide transport periplasmic protein LptA [Massilia sp. W12]|uniref:lipopolysaccharide transport periplasmic protein LptA n=1 Tax=Massilia sp. W12 TaxID=3126507 RepID=UPI0030D09B2E
MNTAARLLAILTMPLLLAAPPAQAERADAKKETQIQSVKADYDSVRETGSFSGNIQLTRGSLKMSGEKLDFAKNAAGYQEFVLLGAPGARASFRQKSDQGEDEWIEGEGERIEYSDQKEEMKIHGQAVLRRMEGKRVIEQVQGALVIYDSLKEVFRAVNDNSGAAQAGAPRVTVVIQPRSEKKAADKPAEKAADKAAAKP